MTAQTKAAEGAPAYWNALENEPTLADVVRDFWDAKWVLLFGAVLGGLTAFLFLQIATPQYRVTMLVGPAERSGGPDINTLLPENSSFAVQYLVNTLSASDSIDFVRFEHILKGRSLAAELAKNDKIMSGMRRDLSFRGIQAQRDLDNAEEIKIYLEKNLYIEPVGTTPLRQLVYNHPDPVFGTYFLTQLHILSDNLIKDEILKTTEKREAHLKAKMQETYHPDHQDAMRALLMEQEHLKMILSIDEPFAAMVAEPASPGPKPHWPRASFFFPVLMLAGMVCCYMVRSLILTLRVQADDA